MPLQREDETIRRFVRPFAKACRRLGAVEGAVHLDRGHLATGIGELARMRQPLRIEGATPRREGPAADTDPDHALGAAALDGLFQGLGLDRIGYGTWMCH